MYQDFKRRDLFLYFFRCHKLHDFAVVPTNPVVLFVTNRVRAIVVTKAFCGLHETLNQKPTTSVPRKIKMLRTIASDGTFWRKWRDPTFSLLLPLFFWFLGTFHLFFVLLFSLFRKLFGNFIWHIIIIFMSFYKNAQIVTRKNMKLLQ